MERNERIRTTATTDYPWPYLAIWERLDDGEWIELEAEGGDTVLDAVETLRAEHPRCAHLLNGYRVKPDALSAGIKSVGVSSQNPCKLDTFTIRVNY